MRGRDVPEALSPEAFAELLVWIRANNPDQVLRDLGITQRHHVQEIVDETLEYHRSTGNARKYKDWSAVMRNRFRYLRKQLERKRVNLDRVPIHKPKPDAVTQKADREPVGIQGVLEEILR